MPSFIHDWLLRQGLGRATDPVVTGVEIALVVILAAIADIVAKRIVVRGLENLAGHTTTSWDDILVKRRLFHRLSHLAPALVVYFFAPAVLDGYDLWVVIVQRVCLVYMLLVAVLAVDGVLSALAEILNSARFSRDLPVKTIVQVLKLLLYSVAAIAQHHNERR